MKRKIISIVLLLSFVIGLTGTGIQASAQDEPMLGSPVAAVKTSNISAFTDTPRQWKFEQVSDTEDIVYRIYNKITQNYLTASNISGTWSLTMKARSDGADAKNQYWIFQPAAYSGCSYLYNIGAGEAGGSAQLFFEDANDAGTEILPVGLTATIGKGGAHLQLDDNTVKVPVADEYYSICTISWYARTFIVMEQKSSYDFDDAVVGESHPDFPAQASNDLQFARVSNKRATSGMNSLWICDNYTGEASVVQHSFAPTDQLTVEFALFPESYSPYCYSIALASAVSSPAYADAIHMLYFYYDGSVKYMTSSYGSVDIFPAGTVKKGEWNSIKIAADINGITNLYINDSAAATVGVAFGAEQYTTLRFASAGGTTTGDSYFIDDLTIVNRYDDTPITKVITRQSSFYDFEDGTVDSEYDDFVFNGINNDEMYAKISSAQSKSGTKALNILDNTASGTALVTHTVMPTKELSVVFDIFPQTIYSGQYGGYCLVLSQEGGTINHMYLFHDGSVGCYDTSAEDGVKILLPAGTVKIGEWNKVAVSASITEGTKISVNNSPFADVSVWNALDYYSYIGISSSGWTAKGDNLFIDDMFISTDSEDVLAQLNKNPVANNIFLSCEKNTSVSGTFHATDENGDALTYTIIMQPANGTVTVEGGSFLYTPDKDYVGRDMFWYAAKDRFGKSNTAAVEVTIQGMNEEAVYCEGRFTIDSTTPEYDMQFPFVYKFGQHIFVSYSEAGDVSNVGLKRSVKISHDNGLTWNTKSSSSNMYFTSMFEKDGIIYGIDYEPYLETDESGTYERMTYWTTSDFGETWTRHEGRVNAPEGLAFQQFYANGSLYFHRDMMVMDDGSVQGCMYGQWTNTENGQTEYGCVWVKSEDNANTWEIVSIIAKGRAEGTFTHWENFCEPQVTRVKDGSLLCVMRTGSYGPMYMSRSFDDGMTWSEPTTLPGLSREQAYSIDPQLLLMENGVLAMAYGRSGALLAFSLDGSGYNWDYYYEVYTGTTEGMCGIVETEPGRLLYVADQGRKGTSEPRIWGAFIQVQLEPQNFSDIAQDIAAKKLEITQAQGSEGISPATGINALTDNSLSTVYIPNIPEGTTKDSSVPNHSVVLDMGEVKELQSVVVRHQFASVWKYKIEVSVNGSDWIIYADKTNNNTGLQNSRDNGNINARYVRYTVTGNQLLDCYNKSVNYAIHNYISIAEIELYGEDVQTLLFTDAATGVMVEANRGVLPADAQLRVKKDILDFNEIGSELFIKNFASVNISFIKDGKEIQPKGKVRITIPVSSAFDLSQLEVYRIIENGDKTSVPFRIEERNVVIETEHLGVYALVEKAVTPTSPPQQKPSDTGDSSLILPYILLLFGLGGSAVFVQWKKRKLR